MVKDRNQMVKDHSTVLDGEGSYQMVKDPIDGGGSNQEEGE